jgi:hypothetical protein
MLLKKISSEAVPMSHRSKRECLEASHRLYKNATRAKKNRSLEEYRATCSHRRKHAIRPFRGFERFIKPNANKRGCKEVDLLCAVPPREGDLNIKDLYRPD